MNKDELKNKIEADAVPISIPEWGEGSWSVRVLSVQEIEDFFRLARTKDPAPAKIIGKLFVSLLCDGAPVFEEKDGEWLAKKPFKFIQRITEDIKRANSLIATEEDAKKN